jgi:hypothetical protein
MDDAINFSINNKNFAKDLKDDISSKVLRNYGYVSGIKKAKSRELLSELISLSSDNRKQEHVSDLAVTDDYLTEVSQSISEDLKSLLKKNGHVIKNVRLESVPISLYAKYGDISTVKIHRPSLKIVTKIPSRKPSKKSPTSPPSRKPSKKSPTSPPSKKSPTSPPSRKPSRKPSLY